MTIGCDIALSPADWKLLEEGAAPHGVLALVRQPGAQGSADLGAAEIAFGQPETAAVLRAPNLKWVQVSSAGYTRYDTREFRAAAAARGLVLTNSSTVYAEPCAEHVFAFMLAQGRRLPAALQTQCKGGSPRWHELRNACVLLRGQRVLLLGFGAIANRLLELLRPFEMHIVAYRRHPAGSESVPLVSLEGLPRALAQADHVINLLPDNPDSRQFISAERLNLMRRGAVLYNIGRGTTVDQDALVAALHSGHVAAAWLDVTDPEPLPAGHPLLSAPNCFMTPHVAGGQANEAEALVRHFLGNLRRFIARETLVDRVM